MRTCRSALAACCLLALTACTGTTPGDSSTTGGADQNGTGSASAGTSTSSPPSCAQQTADGLTPEQKGAQLILVAMSSSTIGSTSTQITDGYAGGVFLLGGWSSVTTTATAAEHIHLLADGTTGIAPWVTIDQEGGAVQQLEGPDIPAIPSALDQAELGAVDLRAQATLWGHQLKGAGIDINLAPVADVVPTEKGTKNAPIGYYARQYGATPDEVSGPMIAFMQGMQDAGITPTVKHFPGIGRIDGNTDKTAAGIADHQLTADDPLLQPFQDAIDEGAPIVMVSTAQYPNLDPANQAAFSPPIVTDLLREKMGFDGVVFSDDVGAAVSVSGIPVADRATRFIEAGGDVVLTAVADQAPTMHAAIVAKYAADTEFADQVDDAVDRVLALKEEQGLLVCAD